MGVQIKAQNVLFFQKQHLRIFGYDNFSGYEKKRKRGTLLLSHGAFVSLKFEFRGYLWFSTRGFVSMSQEIKYGGYRRREPRVRPVRYPQARGSGVGALSNPKARPLGRTRPSQHKDGFRKTYKFKKHFEINRKFWPNFWWIMGNFWESASEIWEIHPSFEKN